VKICDFGSAKMLVSKCSMQSRSFSTANLIKVFPCCSREGVAQQFDLHASFLVMK